MHLTDALIESDLQCFEGMRFICMFIIFFCKLFLGWMIGLIGLLHRWITQMDSQNNEWSKALKRDRKNWNKRSLRSMFFSPFSCRPLHNCPHLYGSFEIRIPAILTWWKCDPLRAFMTILLISSPFHNNRECFGLVFCTGRMNFPLRRQIAFQFKVKDCGDPLTQSC